MKYRVRLDMSFENEADARELLAVAQANIPKASIINTGLPNEESSFCELELCGHDEGKPCVIDTRTELKSSTPVAEKE